MLLKVKGVHCPCFKHWLIQPFLLCICPSCLWWKILHGWFYVLLWSSRWWLSAMWAWCSRIFTQWRNIKKASLLYSTRFEIWVVCYCVLDFITWPVCFSNADCVRVLRVFWQIECIWSWICFIFIGCDKIKIFICNFSSITYLHGGNKRCR